MKAHRHTMTGNTLLLSLAVCQLHRFAQRLLANIIAKVNGVAISRQQFEQSLQERVAQGACNTPELEQLIKDELIVRQLLAVEVVKLELDKTNSLTTGSVFHAVEVVKLELDKTHEALAQIELMKQSYWADLLLNDSLEQQPITDEFIRAEYDRQLAALGDVKTLKQYKISYILLEQEAEARAALHMLTRGKNFELLAQDMSMDPSRQSGGHLDWLLLTQVDPAIALAIKSMQAGEVSAAPIQTAKGWVVLRLDGERRFLAPDYTRSKAQINMALMDARRLELIAGIRQDAHIVQ